MVNWLDSVLRKLKLSRGAQPASINQHAPHQASAPWWKTEYPDWAQPFQSQPRFVRFMDALERDLLRRRLVFRIDPDGVVRTGTGEGSSDWGLANLLANCAQAKESQSPFLIKKHFDALFRASEQAGKNEARFSKWELVERLLRVRLYGDELNPDSPVKTIARRDIPGLSSVVVIDLPDVVQTAHPDYLAEWGKSASAVFDTAFRNTFASLKLRPQIVEKRSNAAMYAIESESFFTATIALNLKNVPGMMGAHGAFVAVPSRHVCLVVPFGAIDAIELVGLLVGGAQDLFQTAPGAISGKVWWTQQGQWFEIGSESSPERISIFPPPELERYISTHFS